MRLQTSAALSLSALCLAAPAAAQDFGFDSEQPFPFASSSGPLTGALPVSWRIAGNVSTHPVDEDHGHGAGRADGHAPIGVMGDHLHKAGEWMLSYRYMRMTMDGNRDGTDSLSAQDVLDQGYMVTPLDMTMEMHMFGAMFAPTDDVTLMAMVPFLRNEMDHLTGMGANFTTESEGLGDISVTALWRLFENDRDRAHLNLGLSLPTGSVDERDATPVNPSAKLPYPMQLGSGTTDLILGGTWTRTERAYSLGAQALATVRLGENDEDYTLGDLYQATVWGAYPVAESTSLSLRLAYVANGNIDGADPELNPAMVPTADPDLRAGQRLDVGLGVNFLNGTGDLAGLRAAAELLLPVYQDLDGPQLEVDSTLVLGLQYAF